MPTGPGGLDARGVWQFGESDDEGLASDTLNLGMESVSTQFAADRTRLGLIEPALDLVELLQLVNRQLDATNTVITTRQQIGIGKITGNNTATISEAVTFPVAFKTGTVPIVVLNYIGSRATGAFNPAGLSAGSAIAGAVIPSATGFSALLNVPAGTLPSTLDFYYSWIAIGERA